MFQIIQDFVVELASPNTFPAHSVVLGIAGLNVPLDDSVEYAVYVVLAFDVTRKVFDRFWNFLLDYFTMVNCSWFYSRGVFALKCFMMWLTSG